MGMEGGTRVVILGAGFGGVAVARTLAKLLPRNEHARITVVDQHNFSLFTPMLTELAAGEVDARHIINPIRELSPRVRFEQGRVEGIDLAAKRVSLTLDGSVGASERKTLEADHLVLALGSIPNFHQISGLAEHALTMKSLGDAITLRNQISALLERADGEADAEKRRQLLTVVVGGGGFSGVETIGALNDSMRASLRYYPHLREDEIRMLIVESGKRLLPELSAKLAAYTREKLEQRGVEVLLETGVKSAGAGYVELDNGTRVATHTLIWTGGVTPSPVIGALDCPKGTHGGVAADATCGVPGYEGVWALGDCAEIPRGVRARPGTGKTYGPTAQNATREGVRVARNIMAVLRQEEPRPFMYTPIGELAIIGRHTGVAQIHGLTFSGVPAWVMWRAIYLFKLPRLSKKVRVAIDWSLDVAFRRDISALPLDGRRVEA